MLLSKISQEDLRLDKKNLLKIILNFNKIIFKINFHTIY